MQPQFYHRDPFPRDQQTNKPSAPNDIMFRDTAFVYRVSMVTGDMGDKYERWEDAPVAIRCSFQEHALDSQHTDPNHKPSRYVRLFTRYRDFVFWHDKIIVRNTEYVVEKVLDHFDNISGDYHHSEIRLLFLKDIDPDAVRQA